jgi:hypothetical protein
MPQGRFWHAFPHLCTRLVYVAIEYMSQLELTSSRQSCWIRLTAWVPWLSFQEMKTSAITGLFTRPAPPPTWLQLNDSRPPPTQSLLLWNKPPNPNLKGYWWTIISPGPAPGLGSVCTSTCLKMTKKAKPPLKVEGQLPTRPGPILSLRGSMDRDPKFWSLPHPSKSPLQFWPNPNCK